MIRNNLISSIPFPRSYWVEPGKLLAGAYPGSKDLGETRERIGGLVRFGIRRIVNLMEPDETDLQGELFTAYDRIFQEIGNSLGLDVSMLRMPIRDLDIPTPALMEAIVSEIDRFVAQSLPVYIHCWGGRGRTGTVVGCWLVQQGLSGREALDRIRWLRRNEETAHKDSPETPKQISMVLNWRRGW